MRHPGAGCFACSSTVEVNVLVFGEVLDLFIQIVGFDADRTFDAFGPDVVVAVAAHVDDLHAAGFLGGGQARGELLDLDPRHDAIFLVLGELHDAIDRVHDQSEDHDRFHGAARDVESFQYRGQEVAGKISHGKVCHAIEQGPGKIELQKLAESHLHASGQWRRHGVYAGNELGDQ